MVKKKNKIKTFDDANSYITIEDYLLLCHVHTYHVT